MKKVLIALLTSLLGLPALALLLLIGPATPAQAQHAIFYVAPGGACAAFAPRCYAGVQGAVEAAAPGDEIRIAAGVYSAAHVRRRADTTNVGVVTQTVYLSKTLTLRGGYSANFAAWDPTLYPTTLDAGGHGRGIYIVGDIAPTIEGLRITGGNAAGMAGYSYFGEFDAGGGVYVLSATVTLLHNAIYSNSAPYGGGVFLGRGDGWLYDNLIADNYAGSGGGGVFIFEAPARLQGNTIRANTSGNVAGGVYLFGAHGALSYNRIISNTASQGGGGVDVASCDPSFNGNLIAGNAAGNGGGMVLWYSRSALTNNVIADNRANNQGSGLWISGSRPRLLHTTIARNGGGDGSGVLIVNSAGASTLAMTNTLFFSQTIGLKIAAAGSTATLAGVLWHSTPISVSAGGLPVTVTQQISGHPAFAADGYHLTAGSAARDQGLPAGVRSDIDMQARLLGLPDLGADEYWPAGSLPRNFYLPAIRR